ncbi:Uncharacterised protein [Mycobacteroides abscessus subsp. abscessus]|nr:Uncharacterised protein [Mycobacteroides abscessus subsp. abscessus]SHY63364.1 Uncharacterised protein [Mycobacteroides abscessus subsp. abscessus]SHY73376.1 Uncharacterised protein [Mycobacteroides abscessus subsp. abscessus]SIA15028.1 Uncharacterised protein [Mycobacteroides abscessus subsp. abscessus]SIB18118.1 Uncharacterised protein [Mycobacteroides abscessus subsp. abscessus]
MPDVQKLAALLDSYAEYRAAYLNVPEPVTACDMERMKFTDLAMWVGLTRSLTPTPSTLRSF